MTQVARTRSCALLLAGLVSVGLAGCSSSGGLPHKAPDAGGLPSSIAALASRIAAATDLPTTPSAPTSAASGGVSAITIRFANLFTKTTAGPALDIYDTPMGQAATPLIKDLAYGAVSAYVHPQLEANSTNITQYYALPNGEDPVAKMADAVGLGGNQDDGSHPQLTLVLTGEKDTIAEGPLGGLSFGEKVEKGSDNGSKGPVAPPAPSGKGEFLADDSDLMDVDPSGQGGYLMIDSSCASPLNGDKSEPNLPEIFPADGVAPVSDFAVFAQAPGLHHIAVATTSISDNLTCRQLTQRQGATTFTLTAGEQVETFVYGTSLKDMHLLLAPIQP